MSERLINHNDLQRLRNEGYEIEIKGAYLLTYSIPYVNLKKEILLGTLVCHLNLAGDELSSPKDHTIYFQGESPCDKDGNVIAGILNSSQRNKLADEIEVDHHFSSKPPEGNYRDYYEKIVTYVAILQSPAVSIDPNVTARTGRVIESEDPDTVFNYLDTSSSSTEIETISNKLKGLKVAIVGLGGTGSYILDFVAKTPVKEIHLFDRDIFLSRNAFRSPGAASIDLLRPQPKKVDYFYSIYSRMHKYIVPHACYVTSTTVHELLSMNFVFVCIDKGISKKVIIDNLLDKSIPFIDVGMGVTVEDGKLSGGVRTTVGSNKKSDHISSRIQFIDEGQNDYNKNIQIAELNALNATFAIIKWKKMFGFYHDLTKEYHSIYETNVNCLINDEKIIP